MCEFVYIEYDINNTLKASKTANLVITANGTGSMYLTDVECPLNAYCNISTYGQYSLENANIFCDKDQVVNGNNRECKIKVSGDGSYSDMMNDLWIFAIEAFTDINLICNNNGQPCFEQSSPARIICTPELIDNCFINATSDGRHWHCTDKTNICNGYVLTTQLPTALPSIYIIF